jgi:hypothetical protein
MQNETSVYLVLAGFPCDPDEITTATGLHPHQVWRVGDQIGPTIRRREDNGWKISAGLPGSVGLNNQVNALLRRIEPAIEYISELGKNCFMEIACVLRAYEYIPEMHLERTTIRQVAMLGADLDIDFYYLVEETQGGE